MTESSKGFGGQERRLIHEAKLLKGTGHRPIIACLPDSPFHQNATDAGMEIVALPMRNSLHLNSIITLYSLIRTARVNVVYSHSGKDSWLAGFAAMLTRTPLIRSRELLTPVRHSYSYSWLPYRVLACSAAVRDRLLAAGVPEHKVGIQFPPVAVKRFSEVTGIERTLCQEELKLTGRFPVITCVGRFMGEKRQIDAIAAMKALSKSFPKALLLLVGSGPKRRALAAAVAKANLQDFVFFTGEREDVPAILSNSDIFVLPSSREPFGMAAVEAMAAGVPVVVSRSGGLAEIVTDGVNGLLVPVESPFNIAAAITQICTEGLLRNQLISGGRLRAEDFGEQRALKSLLAHFYAAIGVARRR
jgi:glycosyltransferase involved in cell wall biosynthesis